MLSSHFITNLEGEIAEHIEYVPFGEVFIEEGNGSFSTPYLYNGKELDPETGYYYYGARYYDPRVSQWLSVDPLAEKYPSWSPYAYAFDNPIRFVDPTGLEPEDIIVTSKNGKYLFTLNDGKKQITIMTAQQLYKKGIQWFEPTADNYMPLKSTAKDIRTTDKMNHFTWDEIADFSEEDRFMISYRPGGSGDWKAKGKPGNGYLLSEVEGTPYWTDALGQIPFAVDKFTDELESTGSAKVARERTIKAGKRFGDGIGIRSDNSNSYDNAMIRRAINWAEKRYKVTIKRGILWDTNILKKTNYSPNNLSKPSNEK